MRFDHAEAGASEQVAQDLPIVLLVLNDENRPHPLSPRLQIDPRRRRERECRSPADAGIDPNSPAMHFDDPSGYGEPKARAALGLGDRAVYLLELVEDSCLIRRGDAGTGVADRERIDVFVGRHLDRDLALVGELNRVADKVEERLCEPSLVSARGWQADRHGRRKRDLLFGSERFDRGTRLRAPIRRPNSRRDEQLEAAKKKLLELKPNIRKIWSTGGELTNLFQNHEIVIAMGWPLNTADLKKANFPAGETIPKENTTGWIDHLMITAASENKDLAYKFLEYMVEAKTQKLVTDKTHYVPANPQAGQFMTPDQVNALHLNDVDAYQKRIYFWQNVPRRAKYNEIWNDVKAAQ